MWHPVNAMRCGLKHSVLDSIDRLGKHFQRCLSQMEVTREGERDSVRVWVLEREREKRERVRHVGQGSVQNENDNV